MEQETGYSMSLLGKIFALLNTLLAFGLGVILVQDLGVRKNWTYLNGLPFDDDETTKTNINIKSNLDGLEDGALKAIFKDAGGPLKIDNRVVLTQVDEVKRMHKKFDDKEKEIEGSDKKAQFLAKLLLENAITYVDRRKYDDLVNKADPKTLADEYTSLRESVDNLFLSAEPREKNRLPQQAHIISKSESRTAIAALLLSLYQVVDEGSEESMRRLIAVVGPDYASKAMDGHAVVLTRTFEHLEAHLTREEAIFVTEHRELLNEMARRAKRAKQIEGFKLEYDERIKTQKALLVKEKLLLAKMEKDLEEQRDQTSKVVGNFHLISERLFSVHKKLQGYRVGNEDQEKKLRAVEANH
jgi:hypothetical protein